MEMARGQTLYFDPDTGASPDSVDPAFMAADSGIDSVRAAIDRGCAKLVAIIDLDVHLGNCTQHS